MRQCLPILVDVLHSFIDQTIRTFLFNFGINNDLSIKLQR